MAFGFREYLKAELLSELLSSLFLGGKHPRIVAFTLLLFLGVFLVFWKILRGIFRLFYWIFSFGWQGKIRHSFTSLKKVAKIYRDRVSSPKIQQDIGGEKWWKSEVLLAGSENIFSFFVHTDTGEIRVFYGQEGQNLEPIALAPYFLELRRRTEYPIEKESDALGEIYRLLRAQYRPELVFA